MIYIKNFNIKWFYYYWIHVTEKSVHTYALEFYSNAMNSDKLIYKYYLCVTDFDNSNMCIETPSHKYHFILYQNWKIELIIPQNVFENQPRHVFNFANIESFFSVCCWLLDDRKYKWITSIETLVSMQYEILYYIYVIWFCCSLISRSTRWGCSIKWFFQFILHRICWRQMKCCM